MGTREELNDVFLEMTPNVYFQPPESIKMKYPCICYQRSNIDQQFADSMPYIQTTRYMVTVISRDPDEPLVQQVSQLKSAIYDRFYTSDNLNHDVFNIYY